MPTSTRSQTDTDTEDPPAEPTVPGSARHDTGSAPVAPVTGGLQPAGRAAPLAPVDGRAIYDRVFWLTYAANVALVMANALTFRFAEFIAFLGGTQAAAGQVVSAGVFAALAVRLWLGQGLDRYGTRLLWAVGCVLFMGSMSLFLLIDDLGSLIYLARIGYAVGISTMFTCSMVHVQERVPADRRTEVIGNLGSSGFVGMIGGAQLGDLIFHAVPEGAARYQALFGGTVVLAGLYFVLVLLLTRGDRHERPAETPGAHRLLWQYWPGNVVLVAMVMGLTISVTTVFLTRYATHLEMANGFGTFFTGYAVTAFSFRMLASRWSRTIGRHKMILLGLTGHTLGFTLLPLVGSPLGAQWQFLLPAACCGFGHALLFPAVVSLGAGAFPKQYRGTGTTLTLGFFDLGAALSAPVLGLIIDHYDGTGFVPMFAASAITAVTIGLYYALTTARQVDEDTLPAGQLRPRPVTVHATPPQRCGPPRDPVPMPCPQDCRE